MDNKKQQQKYIAVENSSNSKPNIENNRSIANPINISIDNNSSSKPNSKPDIENDQSIANPINISIDNNSSSKPNSKPNKSIDQYNNIKQQQQHSTDSKPKRS